MKRIGRRRLLATGTVSLGVLIAGCSGGDGDEGDGGNGDGAETTTQGPQGNLYTVNMTDELEFSPDRITAMPGDTVVWSNDSGVGHSVTAYEGAIPDEADYFASGAFDAESAARDAWPDGEISPGESFRHTFQIEGRHEYFCIPHEGQEMTGTVSVTTF